MTSLYVKLGIGLLLTLAIFGGGWKAGAGHWETKYQALQAEDWKAKAIGERISRVAIEAQLADARRIAESNEESLNELHKTTAAITADRDHTRELVNRLLASAARSRPATDPVPEARHQSGTAPAGQAGSPVEVGELLVDAAAECRGTAAQLNALIGQLKPQL